MREVWGAEPDADQTTVLDAVSRGERRIAIRSGHGVGKTTVLAWIIVWWVVTRFPQKTLCTAATSSQLFDALAAEVKAWIGKLPPALQELFEIKSDRIELRAAPNESFITFQTSRPETPEALAGKHSANMLLIADEASGVHEKVFESAAGSMSGENATTILAGNPVRRTGLFYDVFHTLKSLWVRVHISCVGHPRISQDFIEEMRRRYGEDSNAYRVRVLGEFPIAEDDVVIPWPWLEASRARDVDPLRVKPLWGLDVARKGRDASALCVRVGNVVPEAVEHWKGHELMATVGRVKAKWDATMPSERPTEINIDAIGMGAGVADRLVEMGLPARSINVSEAAAMSTRYLNLRAELWFKGRDFFEKMDCRVGDSDLLEELAKPTWDYTSSGRILVESKKAMLKRGEESPNLADAFLLTLASDAVSASGNGSVTAWKTPLRRNIKGIV